MKKWIFLLLFILIIPSIYGYVSSIPPKNAIGFDYYIANPKTYGIYILAIYNDTDIYIDTALGGTQTYLTSLNALGTTSVSTSYPGSSLIHATKPIVMTIRDNHDGWYSSYDYAGFTLPAAQSLDTEYIVHEPAYYNTYITATQTNTRVLIDTGNDGSWNVNTTITPGQNSYWSSSTASAGSRIVTDKPVVVTQIRWVHVDGDANTWSYEIFNASQKEFYVPAYSSTQTIYIVGTQDDTNVTFDSEGDGIPESSTTLDKAETYSSTSLAYGTLIRADKPIAVSEYRDRTHNRVVAARELGSEHILPYPSEAIYVSATSQNTNILIDKTNDGVWDTNATINSRVNNYYTSSSIQAGSRIKTDKPVDIIIRNNGPYDISSTQPNIALTSDISPSPADYNSLVNITGKIWNMIEIMYNFTVSGSIHEEFIPYPNTATVNISVSKYWTMNDSQVGSTDYLEVSLTGTGPYYYSFDHTDTDLLDEIDDEQYVLFKYKVTTPGSSGTYMFDPFTLDVEKATVWKYPWE